LCLSLGFEGQVLNEAVYWEWSSVEKF
jgi:hypothetical protein